MKGVSIRGIQETQRANLHVIAALKPGGALGRAVQYGTTEAHRYTVAITHVQTGGLRAAHRIKLSGLRGEIYIDPGAVRSDGQRPSVYGPLEHARGGSHAFYERTEREAGKRIAVASLNGFLSELG